MEKTISVIIPAYNEERNVVSAVETVREILNHFQFNKDIIIIDDGSRDKTGTIAEDLAKKGGDLRVFHNSLNRGLGYSLRMGIKESRGDYLAWFPGDNSIQKESMEKLFAWIPRYDSVIGYMENVNQRVFVRKNLSNLFTRVINGLFGLSVTYYNGPFLYPAGLVKSFKLSSTGHGVFAELLIRSIKSGHTYKEVPFIHKLDTEGASKALSLRNLLSILQVISVLIIDVHIFKRPKGG